MSSITTRSGKGSALTNAEVDANFTNLNADKAEKSTTLSGYGITDAQATLVSGTNIKTVNGNSVMGSGNIQIEGGLSSFNSRTGAITLLSGDVTAALGYTPYNSTNPSGFTSNLGTVTSVSGTLPISVATGTTTPVISISQAATASDGYLSSTDWNTFNNKTSNLGTVTSVGGTGTVNGITLTGTVTTTGNLTLGGTLSGVSLTTQVSGTLPVANGGTGTATAFTAGSVVFAGASGVYSQDNASLFFDNTNDRLGIGTSSPSSKLTVGGNPPSAGALAAVGAAAGISLALSDNINCSLYVRHPAAGPVIGTDGGNALRFATNGNAASDEKMRIDSSGNVGIGTASPGGKLEVVGGRSLFTAVSEPFAVGSRYSSSGGYVYFGASNATATPGIQLSFATGAAGLSISTAGVVSGTSFSGAGTGLTGTASGLSIGGNAATVTNGVYTTGDQTIGGAKTFSTAPSISDATGNITFANSGTTKRGIFGTMADNDFWFVGAGGTGSNAGFLEISTGDDGQSGSAAEPIFVRQYGPGNPLTGTLVRSASLLDANGNTSFPGSLAFNGTIPTGATNNLFIGRNSTATNYNSISLNGNPADSANMGMTGGGGSDTTLYINAPGQITFRTNSFAQTSTITAAGFENPNSVRAPIFYDSNDTYYYLDPNGGSRFAGSLQISTNNVSGGGLILADDGDIVDLNDGYCAMRFSQGVRIHSGNRTGGAVITLGSNGTVTANVVNVPSNVGSGTFPMSVSSVDRGISFGNSSGSGIPCYFTVNSGATVSGSIIASGGNTSFNTSSDYRMKENIQPIDKDVALAKIMSVQPVTYNWLAEHGGDAALGFIAHILQQTAPECVNGEKDAVNPNGKIKPQGVDASKLIPTICSAMQKQQQLIEQLMAKVAALEGI
jgi:hypothetical protein